MRVVHPGIAGREAEALELYAARYGLQLPEAPTYHLEFSNPLLLKSVCRAARGNGLTTLPALSRGQAWIFDGLLKDVNDNVSSRRRLDRDPSDLIVQHALQRIAAAMVDQEAETLDVSEAKQICSAIHPDGGKYSQGLLPALLAESLLLRERHHASDQIRITFQRLADFLRAREVLTLTGNKDQIGQWIGGKLAGRSGWKWHGVAAALTALVPEEHGVELVDIARAGLPDGSTNFDRWTESALGQSLLESLTWRQPSSITDRTVELIRQYIADEHLEAEDWVGALLTLSCVPDHPLNADFLHTRLQEVSHADRHFVWAVVVGNIWLTDPNPAARIIDWLWDPDRTVISDTRRLANQLMTWLLGTTARRLRDSATKVLIRLLDDQTAELARLLETFEQIDDWYIVERLLAVAYGHLTRVNVRSASDEELRELAIVIGALATYRPTTHVLIRHYATSALARIANIRGTTTGVPSLEFPKAAWPLETKSVAELSQALGQPDKEYLVGAPMGYDFREKLIGRAVVGDYVPPGQDQLIAKRRVNAKRRFARAFQRLQTILGDEHAPADLIGEISDIEDLPWREREDARGLVFDSLPDGAEAVFKRLEDSARVSASAEPVRLEADVLMCWLTERALELGWVPHAAGGPSERVHEQRLGQDKIETLGKKCIWIAFYELMGVLTDHCLIQEYGNSPESYRHPWQLPSVEDIDPTVALRGDSPPPGSTSARLLQRARRDTNETWWRSHHRSPLRPEVPGDGIWLQDSSDVPTLEGLLSCVDPSGNQWLVLESHSSWERNKSDTRRDPHRHDMWIRTQAYLVRNADLETIQEWAPGKNWMGLWMPTPPHHGPGWFRDYPQQPSWSEWIQLAAKERQRHEDEDVPPEWEKPTREGFPDVAIALATHGSTIRASRDYSATDLPCPLLPSPLLLQILRADLAPANDYTDDRLNLGPVEREYKWACAGEVVMFSTDGWGFAGGSSLLVRASAFSAALRDAGFSCWTWALGEKINWIQGEPTSERMDIFGAAELGIDVTPWALSFSTSG